MIILIKLRIIIALNMILNYILVARVTKEDWVKIYIRNLFNIKKSDILKVF